jgi:hypothetical protein
MSLMTLAPCFDSGSTDWITSSAWPWDRLVTFGPEKFEAYARLRFLPDPVHDGQSEADAEPTGALTEIEQVRIAAALLGRHTRSPEQCFVAWWDGWVDEVAGFAMTDLAATRFDVPHRSYVLLRGSLADFDAWATRAVGSSAQPPAFLWPADRAWCLVRDVDPHWAGIGATAAAIEDLRVDPRLDVVTADPMEPQPWYG